MPTDSDLKRAIDIILEGAYSINSLETDFHYKRLHDGIDGEMFNECDEKNFLTIFVTDYGSDVGVILPPTRKIKMWRFRNCQGGGGQSPRVFKGLIVLMEAIRRDNEGVLCGMDIFSDEEVEKSVDFLLENPYWIETIELGRFYGRSQDDTDGNDDKNNYLSLFMDTSGNADIHIWIYPGRYRTLRFRHPSGGGKSERVRRALLLLAEAIRRDNEINPLP